MKKLGLFVLLTIVGFVLYVAIGMSVPFLNFKETPIPKGNVEDIYYGESVGTDRAHIVETSKEALEIRLQMIEDAQEKIVLSTYSLGVGESALDICAALLMAAERGVKIQILIDGYGSFWVLGDSLLRSISNVPNIEMKVYSTLSFLIPWKLQGRMHDKYLIIDDKTYLLGGRNTSDLFLGESANKEKSFDREIFIYNSTGSADSSIYQLLDYYEKMWNSDFCELLQKDKPKEDIIEKLRQRAKILTPQPLPEYLENTVATNKVTLLFGEIHTYDKEPTVWGEMKNLMMHAKDKVIFHSPYAVLNEEMYQDVKEIVNQVEMKLVVNSVISGENIAATSDYLKNREEILNTGVRLYEFEGILSSHGKSVLIDERISIIGSYNFDLRSTYVNTEMMLVVDSEELNHELETHFEVLNEQAEEVFPNQEQEWKDAIIEEVSWIKRVKWKMLGVLSGIFRYAL